MCLVLISQLDVNIFERSSDFQLVAFQKSPIAITSVRNVIHRRFL